MDTLLKVGDVEVDQEADTFTAEPQIRQQLRVVNGQDRLDRFHLDDHCVVDEQIDSIAELDRESVVHNGKDLLGFDGASGPSDLVRQTRPVRPFEQARSQSGVHFVSTAQDGVRRPSVNETTVPSVRVRSLRGRAFPPAGHALAKQGSSLECQL